MLTPLAVDASHPFPQLLNKSHNLLVRARAVAGEPMHAIVQVPRVVPRLILMPRGKGDEPWDYIYLASLIKHHIADLLSRPDSRRRARLSRDAEQRSLHR